MFDIVSIREYSQKVHSHSAGHSASLIEVNKSMADKKNTASSRIARKGVVRTAQVQRKRRSKPGAPRKLPEQERSQQTVAAILQAAADVLVKRGYAKASTNAIAERAGVSIGSLYQYFPDKYAVYVRLLENHCDAVHSHVWEVIDELANQSRSLDETLRLMLRAVLDEHQGEPQLHRVLIEEVPKPSDFIARHREEERQFAARVEKWLSANPQIRVSDPKTSAHVVVQTAHILTHWLAHSAPDDLDRERFLDESVRMLTLYLQGGK